jgi:malonyl-CoA O-methyltransferase
MLQSEALRSFLSRTLEAYELWAATYTPTPHNPLMRAEQSAMLEYWPDVEGKCALDLACGSGRYTQLLVRDGAAQVFALDFSAAMLEQVTGAHRVRASMMDLPFAAAAFDIVLSGLALGHAPQLQPWMNEAARVLVDDGVLLYSDFHPAAAQVGMVRSFQLDAARTVTLPHVLYEVDEQCHAIEAAGLTVEAVREVRVGHEFQESFPGCDRFYREWDGLPLLLVVRASK